MAQFTALSEINKDDVNYFSEQLYRSHAADYGTWIQNNCLVSRNGFRLLPDLKEEISSERAYELYLESLKSK